jgi:hypothetical protein
VPKFSPLRRNARWTNITERTYGRDLQQS